MILETILKFIWLCQLINKYIIYFISYLISEMKINYIIFVGNTGDLLHKIACNCNSSHILNENSLKLSKKTSCLCSGKSYLLNQNFIVSVWYMYIYSTTWAFLPQVSFVIRWRMCFCIKKTTFNFKLFFLLGILTLLHRNPDYRQVC